MQHTAVRHGNGRNGMEAVARQGGLANAVTLAHRLNDILSALRVIEREFLLAGGDDMNSCCGRTAEHVICQGTVTYTSIDGSTLCVPFVDVLTMRGKLISNYLIYIDTSELYAPCS